MQRDTESFLTNSLRLLRYRHRHRIILRKDGLMASARYRNNGNGQTERVMEADHVKFHEVYSCPPHQKMRERALLLAMTRRVGRLTCELNIAISHREALKMLQAAAACLQDTGTDRTTAISRTLLNGLDVETIRGQGHSPKAKGTTDRGTGPRGSERLLDDKAFREPEQAVTGLEPVEALRLLEEAEPQLAAYVERRMAAVLGPLRTADVDATVFDRLHREVVAMLVTSLLTLRQAYRDLFADVLPGQSRRNQD